MSLGPDHGVSYDLLYQCAQQALRASQKERQSCCTIFGETQEKMLASSSPKSAGPVEDETKTKAIVPTPGPGVVGHYSGILRESEYMLLMNAVNVSVSKHLIDEHYTCVRANEYYYRLIGYSKEKYEKLISGLSVKEKEVISLKILGELSFKEIAKILNEPIGTVQWRYYKALNSLQLLLGNISMLFATLALYIGCMRKNKHGIEVPAINNDSKENSQAHEGNNSHTLEDSKVNTEENTNSQTSQKSKLNNIENTMQEDNVNNQIENEVNNMQAGNTLENNTINIVEIPANNEKTYNVTNNILLSLSSIFLVLTIIFAIICIKHQQNRKNKASK